MIPELRPNEQRAKTAITLIWIILALDVLSFISGCFQYNLLQAAADGESITMDAANSNDVREMIIGLLYFAAYIVSGVTFIQWFRRAYYNLHQRVDILSYSEGWAAGAWFVPIISLFRPFQIMKELYVQTKHLLTQKGVAMESELSTGQLGGWWALWIISAFLGQFSLRYSMRAESIDELSISTVVAMIANVIDIPLALVTIKIIKDYSRVEPLLRVMPVDAGTEPVSQPVN